VVNRNTGNARGHRGRRTQLATDPGGAQPFAPRLGLLSHLSDIEDIHAHLHAKAKYSTLGHPARRATAGSIKAQKLAKKGHGRIARWLDRSRGCGPGRNGSSLRLRPWAERCASRGGCGPRWNGSRPVAGRTTTFPRPAWPPCEADNRGLNKSTKTCHERTWANHSVAGPPSRLRPQVERFAIGGRNLGMSTVATAMRFGGGRN